MIGCLYHSCSSQQLHDVCCRHSAMSLCRHMMSPRVQTDLPHMDQTSDALVLSAACNTTDSKQSVRVNGRVRGLSPHATVDNTLCSCNFWPSTGVCSQTGDFYSCDTRYMNGSQTQVLISEGVNLNTVWENKRPEEVKLQKNR